jgi:hypothetical protein
VTSEIDRSDTDAQQMLGLRTADGAWYELPMAELERARVTDAATLAEIGRRLAADADPARPAPAAGERSVVVLSEELLAPHRADDERAVELEAAGEVAGFDGTQRYHIGGNHRQLVVWTWDPSGFPRPEKVLVLEAAPGDRFGRDTPYLRSYRI